jgi:hypothetical protein
MPPHVPYGLRGPLCLLRAKCNRLMLDAHEARLRCPDEVGEVPGGVLILNSTKLLRPWSPWESSPLKKNPHGRTGNQTQDLMIHSQKL